MNAWRVCPAVVSCVRWAAAALLLCGLACGDAGDGVDVVPDGGAVTHDAGADLEAGAAQADGAAPDAAGHLPRRDATLSDGGSALDGQPDASTSVPDGAPESDASSVDAGSDVQGPDVGLPEASWTPTLIVRQGALVDGWGRSVRLRGASATNTAKQGPDHRHWQGPAEWEALKAEGVVTVRLLVFWDGIEPEPGRLDAAYLEYVRAKVDEIAAAGLLVTLDMHQDLFCQRYSNGAPLWACPDDIPYEPVTPWFLNYLSPAVTGAFDRFWSDAELQGHLVAAWAALGAAVADQPAVVAFEPMNEPWPGSLQPEVFERGPLSAFYLQVIEALDVEAPGRLYVLEPAVTRQLTGRTWLTLPERADLVYGPHFYHTQIEQGGGYQARHQPSVVEEVRRLAADARGLGWPLLLGEYGGDVHVEGFALYLEHLEAELERVGASSALWEHAHDDGGFALYDAAGRLKPGMRPFLRPYALAVPGRRLQEAFDAAAACHTLRWAPTPDAAGPIELRVPGWLSPWPAVVSLEPPGPVPPSVTIRGPRLEVTLPPGQPLPAQAVLRACWALDGAAAPARSSAP